MARFIEAIDVPLAPDKAFAYLADFSRTQEWDPGVTHAKRLTRGKIRAGSRFHVEVAFLGGTLALEYEITEFDAPHRLVLVGSNDWLKSIDEITFAPRHDGTRITYEARLGLAGVAHLADPLLNLGFQSVGARAAEGLRLATGAL